MFKEPSAQTCLLEMNESEAGAAAKPIILQRMALGSRLRSPASSLTAASESGGGPSILSHHCLSTALQTGPGSSWPSRRCLLFSLFNSQALLRKSSPGPYMICTSYLGTTCRSFRGHTKTVDRGREKKFLNPSTLQLYMQFHLLL